MTDEWGWSEINHTVFGRLSRANSFILAELSAGPCTDVFRFQRLDLFTKATQPITNKTSWICLCLEGIFIAYMFVCVCYALTWSRSNIGLYNSTHHFPHQKLQVRYTFLDKSISCLTSFHTEFLGVLI